MSAQYFVRNGSGVLGPMPLEGVVAMRQSNRLGSLAQFSTDGKTYLPITALPMPAKPAVRKKTPAARPLAAAAAAEMVPSASATDMLVLNTSVPTAPKNLAGAAARFSEANANRGGGSQGLWVGLAVAVVLLVAASIVVWVVSQRQAAIAAELAEARTAYQTAKQTFAAGNYEEAEKQLLEARRLLAPHGTMSTEHGEICDLLQTPEIKHGAHGKKKLDGEWHDAALVDATVAARRRDDLRLNQLHTQARSALAAKRSADGLMAVKEARAIVEQHPVRTHPLLPQLASVEADLNNQAVAAEMTAKGMVLFQGRWMTPEQKYHLEQQARGLELYKGQWLPQAEAFTRMQQDKGLELYKGRWVPRDEKMRAEGYVHFDGRWMKPEERASIIAQRETERKEQERKRAEERERARAVEADKENAYRASHEFVKDRLKAPASARFQAYGSRHVHVRYEDGWFHVLAVVDAQNGFGALMRLDYVCKLRRDLKNPDVWRCDDVTMVQRQ